MYLATFFSFFSILGFWLIVSALGYFSLFYLPNDIFREEFALIHEIMVVKELIVLGAYNLV